MVVMKRRMVEGWVAALTVAGVLVVPCGAAAGQDFALDEQVRQREQSVRERERERVEQDRERAEQARERVQQSRERFENLYEQGQNAIERAQWARAIERFNTIVSANAPRADAALYWRAYSLDKLNRQSEALTSVAELLKGFPSSRWLADARALEIQVRQRAGQPVSPDV
jgi:outer membrane protein assembly factor BamD (BamD/ComL family)